MNDTLWAMGIHDAVNIHRIGLDRGLFLPRLKPLAWHIELETYVNTWLDGMIRDRLWGHRDANGNMIAARLAAAGFPVRYAQENLGWGIRRHPAHMLKDWLASPFHRSSIEEPGYVHTAVATRIDPVGGTFLRTDEGRTFPSDGGVRFTVQVFYTSRTS